MAGDGSRFSRAGFEKPKSLIDIYGKPMIYWAVQSLAIDGKYTFITRKYDNEDYNKELEDTLRSVTVNPNIIQIDELTDGAATTVSLAASLLEMNQPLLVTDCDRLFTKQWNPNQWFDFIMDEQPDFSPITYHASTPANSYVKVDTDGYIKEVAEKKVISDKSCNGVHFWARADYFLYGYEKMCKAQFTVNGEKYITPTLQYIIDEGAKGKPFHLEENIHVPVGTPYDLYKFLNTR